MAVTVTNDTQGINQGSNPPAVLTTVTMPGGAAKVVLAYTKDDTDVADVPTFDGVAMTVCAGTRFTNANRTSNTVAFWYIDGTWAAGDYTISADRLSGGGFFNVGLFPYVLVGAATGDAEDSNTAEKGNSGTTLSCDVTPTAGAAVLGLINAHSSGANVAFSAGLVEDDNYGGSWDTVVGSALPAAGLLSVDASMSSGYPVSMASVSFAAAAAAAAAGGFPLVGGVGLVGVPNG